MESWEATAAISHETLHILSSDKFRDVLRSSNRIFGRHKEYICAFSAGNIYVITECIHMIA